MYEYEINVAKNGRHSSLIKLGRITEAEAIEEARFYAAAFSDNPALTFTLSKVQVRMSQQVAF